MEAVAAKVAAEQHEPKAVAVVALAVRLDAEMCDVPICKHDTCDGLGRTGQDAATIGSSGKGVCSEPDVVSQESLMDN